MVDVILRLVDKATLGRLLEMPLSRLVSGFETGAFRDLRPESDPRYHRSFDVDLEGDFLEWVDKADGLDLGAPLADQGISVESQCVALLLLAEWSVSAEWRCWDGRLFLYVEPILGGRIESVVEFLSAEADYLSLHGHTLLEQIIHEVEHAFLPEDMQLRYVGWVTILLAFIIGPIMAARIYGGALKEGEKAIPLVHWLTSLSGKFGSQNVDDLANSELAEALQQRLYFDDLYEGILARTIVPFAAFAAWFDANVIDGAIKQIESKSVLGSVQIRRVTTGSARDYILMAAIGALSIFALIWGVNA